MSDESDWMPPADGTPPPQAPSDGVTPPPPPPSGPYLPPSEPFATTPSTAPTAPGVAGPPSMTVPAGPPPPTAPYDAASPPPSRRRKGVLVAAVVTVLAVGGAGTFAATQLAGSNAGGADSAQELGEQMLVAIENEDVLGILDMLMPGEREVFKQPTIDWVSELSRLEVLSADTDLGEIQGIDLSITDGSVEAVETNVDDITNLALSGEITAEIDGEALPVGELILDFGEDIDLSELDESTSTELDIPLTAVEVDGRWYLSVFFTIAEQARASAGELDIPASGIEASGGESPEDALDELLDGLETLDLAAIIAALNPGEAAALQRYAPLFIDDAQSMLDEAPIELDFTQSEYTVTGDGARRHASIDVLVVEGSVDGTAFELKYADGCVTASAEGEEVNSCELDEQLTGEEFDQVDDMLAEGPVRDLIDVLTEAFADYDQPGVTLVETDGSWYVSPIGTYYDQLLALIRALDRAELDAIIEAFPPAADAFFEDVFGADFDIDDPFLDDPFSDDPFSDDVIPEDTFPEDTFPDDTIVDDTIVDDTVPTDTAVESPLTRCWEAADATEASACFQEVVAAGEAQAWEAPLEMLHPECGVAEAYWTGFTMTDAEFFAIIDAARPCFLALVTSGELLESDLPIEYRKPECFEGRNWYQVFGEPEYDERVATCSEG
ncbi:MAG TPA: hypothetical protein VNO51_02605 [Ilumatobacteraceae bacterium]|nr:hypothetical protein [Ilumatobacteraceae bacterium]